MSQPSSRFAEPRHPVSSHRPGDSRHAADRPREYLKCRRCGLEFSLAAPGTQHRNHCPHCLWSVHLDDTPGDRASECRGGMEPIAVAAARDGEWHVVHRCGSCGTIHLNRIAGDDDERALLALALRPLSQVPFPL